MDDRGQAVRGSRSSAQSDILSDSCSPSDMVNCNFVPKDFVLCLPGETVANFLSSGDKPFSLNEYKEIAMLDFCKLVFYLRESDRGLSDHTLSLYKIAAVIEVINSQ